jgi:hypothetical protein
MVGNKERNSKISGKYSGGTTTDKERPWFKKICEKVFQ